MNAFHTQGPVPFGSPAYVQREFEESIYREILNRNWVLLLGPRQHGKTTSLIRIRKTLEEAGMRCAIVDLQRLPPCDSYTELLRWLGDSLAQDLGTGGYPTPEGTATKDIYYWLEAAVPTGTEPIAIIIDEASGVPQDEWRNSFFGQIRAIATKRADASSQSLPGRVRFIFAGTFRPEALVDPRNSPFNVCTRIETTDLGLHQARSLWQSVAGNSALTVADGAYEYVGGQPYLLQKLFYTVTEKNQADYAAALEGAKEGLITSDHFGAIVRQVKEDLRLESIVMRMVADGAVLNQPADADYRFLPVLGIARREETRLTFRNRMYRQLSAEAFSRAEGPANLVNSVDFMANEAAADRSPTRILHLSDLHLRHTSDPVAMLQPLVADLNSRFRARAVDYLVVSGDFTDRGRKEGFARALELIRPLLDRLDVKCDRCVLVPGNHDVDCDTTVYTWKPKRSVDVRSLGADEYLERDEVVFLRDAAAYPRRFEVFSQELYEPLLGRPYPVHDADQQDVCLFEDTRVQFVALNSCSAIDFFHPKRSRIHLGALARALEAAEQQLSDAITASRLKNRDPVLRVAVWHHAITGNEKIFDDPFVDQLRVANVKLCLHGDVHEERPDVVGALHGHKILVAGVGAFGANAEARPESTPRFYNMLEIDRDHSRIRVYTRQMPQEGGAWKAWAAWPGEEEGEYRDFYEFSLV